MINKPRRVTGAKTATHLTFPKEFMWFTYRFKAKVKTPDGMLVNGIDYFNRSKDNDSATKPDPFEDSDL